MIEVQTADDDKKYELFNATDVKKLIKDLKCHQVPLENFLKSWNTDPTNRSKIGELRKHLEETKEIMVNDLELTIKRGQLL